MKQYCSHCGQPSEYPFTPTKERDKTCGFGHKVYHLCGLCKITHMVLPNNTVMVV